MSVLLKEDIKDLNIDITNYYGLDLKMLTELEWFTFAKANQSFGEPGIAYGELWALYEALKTFNAKSLTIVETGICFGTTTRFFLMYIQKYGGELHSFEVLIRPKFEEAMRNLGLWNDFYRHGHSIKDSWPQDKQIDFLFIDSEHALQDALGEYMRFRVYLRDERSVIGFHDVNCSPGVAKAIEMIQEVDELELVSESISLADAGIKFFKRKQIGRIDRPWNSNKRS